MPTSHNTGKRATVGGPLAIATRRINAIDERQTVTAAKIDALIEAMTAFFQTQAHPGVAAQEAAPAPLTVAGHVPMPAAPGYRWQASERLTASPVESAGQEAPSAPSVPRGTSETLEISLPFAVTLNPEADPRGPALQSLDETAGKLVSRVLNEDNAAPDWNGYVNLHEAYGAGLNETAPEAQDIDGATIDDIHEIAEITAQGMANGADPVEALYAELAEMQEEDDQPPPPMAEAELWQRRMDTWRGARLWLEDWGPRPGQAGCQAPSYLMNGRAR